jgi:hypothetical protein
MTTARALLRRLIFHGRIDPTVSTSGAEVDAPALEHRLEAARQRLKQTIPAPAEDAPPGPAANAPPGHTANAPPGHTQDAPSGHTQDAPPGHTQDAPSGHTENAPGQTIPPPDGVSPGQESPPVR